MSKPMKTKPIAVLISDVHYNLQTLPLADAAMHMAIDKANELNVALIVAGDLHDTKANVRGECMAAMKKTFNKAINPVTILRGNHDSINEKSTEHSLQFLPMNCSIVAVPRKYDVGILKHWIGDLQAYFVPYFHNPNELREYLQTIPIDSLVIMHQGVQGSNSGDYIQDKSAIMKEDVKDFRVISGHYHARQDIRCGRPRTGNVGLFSFIGNPYTLSFGEAKDPEKGFQILHDDGSLEFVPTNLRKHVIVDCYMEGETLNLPSPENIKPNDLVWVKVKGTRQELASSLISRKGLAAFLRINENFKLDLIPTDTKAEVVNANLSKLELMDNIIDSLAKSDQSKRLKQTWRDLCD